MVWHNPVSAPNWCALANRSSIGRRITTHLQASSASEYARHDPDELTIDRSALFRNNYTMLGVVFAAGFGFEMCVYDYRALLLAVRWIY